MTLTNSLGLPEPIVNAIRSDDYSKGDCDFSVTELIKPVRIRALGKKWSEHLTEDVSDRIFSLFGRAVHSVLEHAGEEYVTEERFISYIEFLKIGGQIDVYDSASAMLSDYKLCSRYVVGDGVKPEWEQQMNCNAYLMRDNNFPVSALQIVAIFRDWSKIQAERKQDYPQKQVQILPVAMWPDIKTEAFIRERIKAHQEGEENPPICTPDERWRKPDKWALMKKGSKRAVKLYDTEEEANRNCRDQWTLMKNSKFHYVESRPGEDVRCLYYCPVNKYCSYYQGLMQEKIT